MYQCICQGEIFEVARVWARHFSCGTKSTAVNVVQAVAWPDLNFKGAILILIYKLININELTFNFGG